MFSLEKSSTDAGKSFGNDNQALENHLFLFATMFQKTSTEGAYNITDTL